MSKVTLTDLVNLQNETTAVNAINTNNHTIRDAIDSSLWRMGSSPNEMEVTLDMNSNKIINLPAATTDFEPVRLQEFNRALFDATEVVLSYGLSNGLNFDTRAAAQATQIPLTVNYITISKYATGYPRCDAPYVRGGTITPLTDGLGNQWGLDLSSGAVHAFWFGVKADGTTDDTAAFQTAVNNSANCVLYVKGRVGLSSFIHLVSNTTIQGLGLDSGFIALGSNLFSKGLLYINNISTVTLKSLSFTGNLTEPAAFSSGAIRIELDTIASGDMENINIISNVFRAFKTSEWIGVFLESNIANIHRLIGLNVSGNYVYATPSCISTTGGNVFLQIFANTRAPSQLQGDVTNVLFQNNTIVGLGLSGAMTGFASVHNVTISGNATLNMGNSALSTDRTYTYLFYNSDVLSYNPFNISIVGNNGYGHHNNAVYLAGAMNSVVSGNTFQFVSPGGIEPTLPWGAAIALNATRNITVTGNTLTNALGGIALVSVSGPTKLSDASDTHTISNNSIYNTTNITSPQVPYGILVSGVPSGPTDSFINISSNTIKVTATQSVGISIVGTYIGNVRLSNNLIEASYTGIGTTGTVNTSRFELINNSVSGTLNNYAIDIGTNLGQVFLINNTADFANVTAGSTGGVRLNGTEVYIDGLILYNKTNSGNAVTLDNILLGTMRGVSFPLTTSTHISSGLGYNTPTFIGKPGDFVQNLGTLTEQGSAGSKYMLLGWICLGSTVWVQSRSLTGN